MGPFHSLSDWPVENVAAAVVAGETTHRHGPTDRAFPLASVTKLFTAMAALVAHEEGTLPLDEPILEGGATAADLLAHSAGISPDEAIPMTLPHTRRIYSTAAYELLADNIAQRSGIAFADYLHEAVTLPLGLRSFRLAGSPGAGGHASVDDLVRLAGAWTSPLLVDQTTLDRATRPHMGQLNGVLPGYGRQDPNPWGLGPEIRGQKNPHWTAETNSPATFGHFGQSGTMLWIDPAVGTTTIALTDRDFGPWAIDAWPRYSAAALNS